MSILLRSPRRGPIIFVLSVVLVVVILLHRSKLLIGLLFEDGAQDAIYPELILEGDAQYNDSQVQLIPKIIHQTYINTSLPKVWEEQQKQLLSLHNDYQYMFWTDNSAHDFIANEYSWFLHTYDSYPYNIQRADAIRYFVLAHFGGIYLDLDIAPYRRLDPLLLYPAWSCRTLPTGISNDALGATAGHPFFMHVIDSLETYNRNWLVPYITVMYTTGPLFLSVMWKEYIDKIHDPGDRILVLMRDEEHFGNTYGFFNNTDGGSWHGKDVEVIRLMGKHWVLVTILGFLIGFGVTGALWLLFRRCSSRSGYRLLKGFA